MMKHLIILSALFLGGCIQPENQKEIVATYNNCVKQFKEPCYMTAIPASKWDAVEKVMAKP